MKNHQAVFSMSILFFILIIIFRYNAISSLFYRQIGVIGFVQALTQEGFWSEPHFFMSSNSFDYPTLAESKNYFEQSADERSQYYLGISALAEADYHQSLFWFEQTAAQDNLTRLFSGEGHFFNDNLDQTIVEWGQIGAQNQMIELAAILEEQGDTEKSRRILQSALAMNNLSVRNQGIAHRNLARSFYEDDSLAAAETHFKALVELFPGDGQAYALLGNIYRRQKDYATAMNYFDEALKLGFVEPAWIWTNKGRTYAAMGAWDDAVDAYEQALEAQPNDPTALSLLVRANCKNGNELAARSHFELLRLNTEGNRQALIDELTRNFAACLNLS